MKSMWVNDLAERIVMLIARVYPLFRQFFKDYHPDEILILHILRVNEGKIERRRLIQELREDPKVVSRKVRRLVRQGLVESYRNLRSARESIDKITKKGNRKFENIRKKMKFLIKEGFSFIETKEFEILSHIVNQAEKDICKIIRVVKNMLY